MIHLMVHYTKNWEGIANISIPIMEEYCDRHGYVLHIKKVPNYDRYNGLHKLKMIDAIDNGDFAMLLDSDALITNLNIKVEGFIDLGYYYEFYLSEGANCGVIIAKKMNRGVIDVICEGISHGQFNCEQDAVEYLLKKEEDYGIKILPHPCFNSYLSQLYPEIPQPVSEEQGQWVEGSFILHLPALPISQRIEIMKNTKITR